MSVDLSAKVKICPLLSGRPILVTIPKVIMEDGIREWQPLMIPCLKNECQWWENDHCSFRDFTSLLENIGLRLSDLVEIGKEIEPPSVKSGGSSLTRLAIAVEELVDHIKRKKNP
jgi:hypothetical protein